MKETPTALSVTSEEAEQPGPDEAGGKGDGRRMHAKPGDEKPQDKLGRCSGCQGWLKSNNAVSQKYTLAKHIVLPSRIYSEFPFKAMGAPGGSWNKMVVV